MSIRMVAAVLAAIGLGACSLYGGLDGFTSAGDPPDAAASDGGTSTTTEDGATPPPEDGSVTSPADADATTPPTDAGGDARFCTGSTSALCADFDDPSGPLATWSKVATGTSDVALVSTGALSAPNAIRATAGASGSNRWGYFRRDLGNGDVDHAKISYALYVEQRPATNELEVNGFVFYSATNDYEFYLAITPTGAFIVEQSTEGGGSPESNYHDIGSAIPTGTWVRITLEVTLTGATKELVLAVDGTERARKALTLTAPGKPSMRAGITWADKTAAGGAVIIDDLRFDVLP